MLPLYPYKHVDWIPALFFQDSILKIIVNVIILKIVDAQYKEYISHILY